MGKKMYAVEEELAARFERAAAENGSTPDVILDNFIKDYIVSAGHPDKVEGARPWNRPCAPDKSTGE